MCRTERVNGSSSSSKKKTSNNNGTTTAAKSSNGSIVNQNNNKNNTKEEEPWILFSVESYSERYHPKSYSHPSMKASLRTGLLFVLFLLCCEHLGRLLFYYNQQWHSLLQIPVNRYILSRHLFVDTVSCTICAYLGWNCRSMSLYPVIYSTIPRAGYEQRLFTYSPHAYRLALVFFWYQVKNLVDTIIWNDGPEFIFHHIFSMITPWGAMTQGCGHMYAIFFFGLSEISTAVLCILANFDDVHGVLGMGEALPLTKIVLATTFTITFIICRCILWPWISYYFCRDILDALRGNDPRAKPRRHWMRFFLVSLSGLSILQVAWLGQIYILGKNELEKMGFL